MARVGVSVTFDVVRPFGGSTLSTGNSGTLYDDASCGRLPGLSGTLSWTEFLDCEDAIDVEDGCTRSAGSDSLLFNDGDQITLTSPLGTIFVVVFVSHWYDDATSTLMKRVYLLRDSI